MIVSGCFLKTGELKKVVEGGNDDIYGLFIHKNYLYIAGNFNDIGAGDNRIKLHGKGVVRYNLETGELEKVVDGANDLIYGLFIHKNYLYVSGGFTEIGIEDNKVKLNGKGVVRYNLETRELEKIIEGANSWTYGLFIHNNYLYISGEFGRKVANSYINFSGNEVVRYNLKTGKLEKIVVVANGWISGLFIAPP